MGCYRILRNGLKIQWGNLTPAATKANIVLPLSFSNRNFSIAFGDGYSNNNGNNSGGFAHYTGINKINDDNQTINISVTDTQTIIRWIAVGF